MTAPAGRSLLPADRAPWHPLARLGAFIAAVAVAGLLAQAVLYPVAAFVLEAFGVRPLINEWLMLAGAIGGSMLAVRFAESDRVAVAPRVALGAGAGRASGLTWGVVLGAAPMGLALAFLMTTGAYGVEAQPADGLAMATGRALLVLAPAAAAEELLARGYPFTVLQEWQGPAVATGVTALAFAALHALNPGVTPGSLVNVALAGVLLALVRRATGSLAAAIVAHLAWNVLLVVVAHAPVSGLAFATPGWRLVPRGAPWLTGGAWGPEGSLVTTATLVLTCALLWRRVASTDSSAARASAPTHA